MRNLVAVGSVKGSPGATTLALAVAGHWPTVGGMVRPLVVEADPAGGDVAARFALSDTPGLMALAAAVRRAASPEVVEECVQVLPGGVPVVAGPAGGQQAAAAVTLFAGSGGVEALRGDAEVAGTVLLDLGRLEDPTLPLVRAADVLLLVTRGEVEALAHIAARAGDLNAVAAGVELVVVGPSPYPASEIGAALGIGRVHAVPWDPRTAAALAGRAGVPGMRRERVSPLARAAGHLGWHLAALTEQPSGVLGRDLAHLELPAPLPPAAQGARVLEAGEVR
jgi:MinD-like ATPase involved in chromosome partitioning or flagellar assembly